MYIYTQNINVSQIQLWKSIILCALTDPGRGTEGLLQTKSLLRPLQNRKLSLIGR